MPVDLEPSETTISRVYPTTLVRADRLSERLGVDVLLASETFQRTGSFKFRAAYSVASKVPNQEIITASSGNFGQALACACRMLNKSCIVVMPATSSAVKVEAVRAYGAQVELIDVNLVARAERVSQLAADRPGAYVASAYDDDHVIAGNSSLGRELAAAADFNVVVCPVGGGGLISGVVTGLREAGCESEVAGAEPALANDAARSVRSGRLMVNESEPATIADGARTLSLGRRNWEIIKTNVRVILEVSEDAIGEATRLLFGLANLKCEPTGALAVGAVLTHQDSFRGKRVVCVVSGGNVDSTIYQRILSA